MVGDHLLGMLCRILMLMTYFSKADRYNPIATWNVAKKVIKYGDDLSLYCQVEHCCLKPSGWIKWTSENAFSTIFIDVKDLTVDKNSKYTGKIDGSGFFLVIRNLSREDLGVNYSCTYGFYVSKTMMLLENDAFAKPKVEGVDSSKHEEFITSLSWIAFALCIFWLVPVAICCRNNFKEAVNRGTSCRLVGSTEPYKSIKPEDDNDEIPRKMITYVEYNSENDNSSRKEDLDNEGYGKNIQAGCDRWPHFLPSADAELCETGMTTIIIENCPDMFQTQTILDLMNKYGEVYTCKCRSGSLKREPGSVTNTTTVTNTWYIELIKLNQTIPPCITLGEFHINIFVENSIPHENEYRD